MQGLKRLPLSSKHTHTEVRTFSLPPAISQPSLAAGSAIPSRPSPGAIPMGGLGISEPNLGIFLTKHAKERAVVCGVLSSFC